MKLFGRRLTADSFTVIVAILGSPYLLFLAKQPGGRRDRAKGGGQAVGSDAEQASREMRRIRFDTFLGWPFPIVAIAVNTFAGNL